MIRGLSEKRRLPRLGKVKLGVMVHSQGGKPYPRSVDYFVCPSVITAVYGDQPKELPIMLEGRGDLRAAGSPAGGPVGGAGRKDQSVKTYFCACCRKAVASVGFPPKWRTAGLNPLRLVCDECDKAEKLARKRKESEQ